MGEPIFSITEINEYVRMVLDSDPRLHHVWLRGEISNFTNHYKTGHFYFSLKDETSSLRAVMFRGSNAKLTYTPQNGMRVLAHGEIRSYPRDGQTQIVVDDMQPDGAGSLALAFEQLRRRLEAEGLFDTARKKPLPRYPARIGVITSATGAAIHDIIRITSRRYPLAQIFLYPALVQGEGAPESLCSGVEFFNAVDLVDVIILGRGGGSAEDLWAFNDERLARTVAASHIPVISAVGHESDVTICDFVADVRAPTPSGAAEMAVPDKNELYAARAALESRLNRTVQTRLFHARQLLERRSSVSVLSSPRRLFDDRRMRLCLCEERLLRALERDLEQCRTGLASRAARLEGLSPLAVLSRGYVMVSDPATARTLTSTQDISVGDTVSLRFSDGSVEAHVNLVTSAPIKQKKR